MDKQILHFRFYSRSINICALAIRLWTITNHINTHYRMRSFDSVRQKSREVMRRSLGVVAFCCSSSEYLAWRVWWWLEQYNIIVIDLCITFVSIRCFIFFLFSVSWSRPRLVSRYRTKSHTAQNIFPMACIQTQQICRCMRIIGEYKLNFHET